MEISVKSLWMAASVVITAALITIGVFQYGNAKRLTSAVGSEMRRMTDEIEAGEILRYDGAVVKGCDVVNFCKRYLSGGKASREITVTVINRYTKSSYESYSEAGGMVELNEDEYIVPTDSYMARVEINGNNVITGVTFKYRPKNK